MKADVKEDLIAILSNFETRTNQDTARLMEIAFQAGRESVKKDFRYNAPDACEMHYSSNDKYFEEEEADKFYSYTEFLKYIKREVLDL